ncbi:sensor histidine kinase [Streptomyces sp. NPDC002156]
MIKSLRRLVLDHPRAVNVTVAVVPFACSSLGSIVTLPGAALPVTWWPGVLLSGVSCTALLWRRSHPRTAVAVITVSTMAIAALGYLVTALMLGPLMAALYSLAVRTDRRTAYAVTFTCIAMLVGTAVFDGPTDEPLALRTISPAAWLIMSTVLGTTHRLRAAYLEAVQTRAEHAERTREDEARHRVIEERVRIARELHDVAAHHLALANAQAGTVAHLMRSRPDEAAKIVAELAGTTSAALRELKATVGLLRRADDTDEPLQPVPGLAQLPELTASFQSTGLIVTVTTDGDPRPLSAGAELTAYRIVQEALTNVTKHAVTGSADVRLVYANGLLGITVTNEGGRKPPSPPAPDSGYGLIGMRERAASAGGRLRVGHRPQGGFEVFVELPLCPLSL